MNQHTISYNNGYVVLQKYVLYPSDKSGYAPPSHVTEGLENK